MKKNLFVAICGLPNTGKSTFLNAIMGQTISGVSSKPQTTRNSIKAILTQNETQVVFIDTPGLFVPKKDLERKIVSNAKTANLDADLVCVMFDGRKEKIDEITLSLLEKHKRLDKKVIFVINKIDSYSQDRLIAQLSNLFNPSLMDEIVPLSALKNVGVEELKDLIFSCAKEGEWHYGEDDITDRDNYFITAEVLREKVFENLNQELPYSIDVVTDKITQEGDVFKIMQTIYVEKQGQKNIVIGSKGSMISKIIKQSIPKLQEVMQGKVVLNVFVKISKDWIEKWSGK